MTGTIELSKYFIDAIADAVVKKMQEPILDKVLEDIKTEIEECWQMYEDRFDVSDCLDIIDKHISGKESK